MQWFYDMKIGKKLITSFLLMAVIAGIIGYVGISKLTQINKSDTQLYENMTVPISQLSDISTNFQRIRVNTREITLVNSLSEIEDRVSKIEEYRSIIEQIVPEYEKKIVSEEMKRSFLQFTKQYAEYAKFLDELIVLARANKNNEAMALIQEHGALALDLNAVIGAMDSLKVAQAKQKSDANTVMANTATRMMLIVLVIGILAAILMGVFITNVIGNPVKALSAAADKLAQGDTTVQIEASTADEVGDLMRSFDKMIKAINALNMDMGMLSKAAVDGKLDARADASRHQGDYRKIVQGVNDTLDAVIGPLNVAAEYIDRISKGDIPPKVTDAYNGDFNEIKNNLNGCIDAVNLLIVDTEMLGKAAIEEKFDMRADATRHQGDFRKVVNGMNGTLDTVVDKVVWYESILDNVPFPLSVTDSEMNWTFINSGVEKLLGVKRKDVVGKKCSNWNANICSTENCGIAKLRKNIPQTVFNQGGMNFQVDTAYILNRKGERIGHIEFVQDITAKVRGVEYQKVEVDRLADNLKLLSEGNLKLDTKVSEGDEFTRMERENFQKINASLAQVKDAVGNLITDAGILSAAAVNGQLDTRADASKHQGDYRKIMQGVNDTLDAVIRPLNVAAEYIDRISKGDIPPKITDAYKGDFNEIKNNLNACIDGLGGLVEVNAVLQRMADNDYTVTVDGQYQGVYAEVARATNEVQDRIKHVIAIVNRISVGDLSDLDQLKQMGNGKGRRSEKDELVPAYIRMIENLKATIIDIDLLARNSLEGKLDTRADASRHEGDFRKIVEGVNATLDAVIEPVNEAVGCIEQMAEGDLTAHMAGDYKGDLAKMKNALNATLESLNDILGQVNTASEQVVSGATQVSDAAQSLSQGATEQASSLEEITASMTEMNSQTRQNAENAQQANKLAAAARDNAQTGNERMREMLGAMKEINDSSGQISKIIKVIDEIAFQTNLLALNAAVEAARAGVHGKGFAVVADEVRNLAQRSAKAAKETTELIENSIKKVENGTGIANETAKALNEIVSGVTKVTDLVGEIASASNEQAQGIAQVNQGLNQVDQVTQSNTANAEESAAAAEELSGQAANLQQMITRFQLVNHNGTRPGVYGPEQYIHRAPEHKSNGGNGKIKVKGGSMMGLEGKKPAQRKIAASSKQALSAPAGYIALDDDEFGKY